MCSQIEQIVNANKNSVIYIGGDLNLPDIDWKTNSISGSQYSKAINQRYLDLINLCNLQQSVCESTRKENILDIFLTNRPSLVNKCITIPGLGDHDAVLIDTNTKAKLLKPIKRKILLWNRTDLDALKAAAK